MIFNKESIDEFLNIYPNLEIIRENEIKFVFSGYINVDLHSTSYSLRKQYYVIIYAYKDDYRIPEILDIKNQIKKDYPHIGKDGKLCLATDIEMRLELKENYSLIDWMKKYVEPFFFSYEYYNRFGSYYSGERGHGSTGIIQTYQEIFNTNEDKTLAFVDYLANISNYRGHVICPCGSGKRLRNCHKEIVHKFLNNSLLKRQIYDDWCMIKGDKNASIK